MLHAHRTFLRARGHFALGGFAQGAMFHISKDLALCAQKVTLQSIIFIAAYC